MLVMCFADNLISFMQNYNRFLNEHEGYDEKK